MAGRSLIPTATAQFAERAYDTTWSITTQLAGRITTICAVSVGGRAVKDIEINPR